MLEDLFYLVYLWLCKARFSTMEIITGNSLNKIARIVEKVETRIIYNMKEIKINAGSF
jgi:hypothetical protein